MVVPLPDCLLLSFKSPVAEAIPLPAGRLFSACFELPCFAFGRRDTRCACNDKAMGLLLLLISGYNSSCSLYLLAQSFLPKSHLWSG